MTELGRADGLRRGHQRGLVYVSISARPGLRGCKDSFRGRRSLIAKESLKRIKLLKKPKKKHLASRLVL